MPSGVIEEARLELGDVSDPLAVWRPCGRGVCAGVGGDLGEMSAFIGVIRRDNPDIDVVAGVRVRLGAIAAEGKELAVRRPGRLGIVEVTGSDLRKASGR